MKKYLTKEVLDNLGIFELRNLARDVGVSSPTTLRKEELVKEIIAIISGDKKPQKTKTKQGRPPKSLTTLKDMMSTVIPDAGTKVSNKKTYTFNNGMESNVIAREFDFGIQNLIYNADGNSKNTRKATGIIKLAQEGHAFCYEKGYPTICNEHNFFLPITMVQKYRLKSGDSVCCTIRVIDQHKPRAVNSIETINGENAINYTKKERKDFCSYKAIHPREVLKFRGDNKNTTLSCKIADIFSPVGKGQRMLISYPSGIDAVEHYSPIVSKISKYMDKMFCLLIDERPEDEYDYKENLKNTEIVSLRFSDSEIQRIEKIKILISRMKRLAEDGQNVFLTIMDLKRLVDFYKESLAENSNVTNLKYSSVMQVKRFLSLARNMEGAGSLTIAGSINNSVDKDIINEIKQVCNSYIVLDDELKNCMGLYYNIKKSLTIKDNLLLNKRTKEFQQRILKEITNANAKEKLQEIKDFKMD